MQIIHYSMPLKTLSGISSNRKQLHTAIKKKKKKLVKKIGKEGWNGKMKHANSERKSGFWRGKIKDGEH